MIVTDEDRHLVGLLEYQSIVQYMDEQIPRKASGITDTGNELSELFRVGMSGFLQIMNR